MLFGVSATAGAASAAPRTTCQADSLLSKYSASYHAVAKDHGSRAPGRNIRKWGLKNNHPSSCKHIAESYRTLRAMQYVGSNAVIESSSTLTEPEEAVVSSPGNGTNSHLQSIKQCESGGDYSARSGQYGGAYQFSSETWASVGGTGDPASASPAEQDMRAQKLYDQSGPGQWPVCQGR